MDTLVVACVAIPVVMFGKTVVQDWDTVRWIHFPRWDAKIMAAKKKASLTWKMRDGSEVLLADMSGIHLANAIKMVARNCHRIGYLGDMKSDSSFLKLIGEAKKRKFHITILNVPITIDGRKEYVEVLIPTPRSKIKAGFFPTDWDSRPQE